MKVSAEELMDFEDSYYYSLGLTLATWSRSPVNVYVLPHLFETPDGDIRATQGAYVLNMRTLEQVETEGEPPGQLWAVIEPTERSQFRISAKAREAAVAELEDLNEVYERTWAMKRQLPPDAPEPPPLVREETYRPAALEEVEVTPEGMERLLGIGDAVFDLYTDPEIVDALVPYMLEAERDPETGLFMSVAGPRTGRERRANIQLMLFNFIAEMTAAEGEIDKESLKNAFLEYIETMQRIGDERRAPEVAAQTIDAFSYVPSRTRTSKGSWDQPKWTGVKPESMQQPFPSPDDPRALFAEKLAKEWLANMETAKRARQAYKREERAYRKTEPYIETHSTGTVSAGRRRKKKGKRIRKGKKTFKKT